MLVNKNRVITPDGFIGPDFLERRYYDCLFVRQIPLYISPIARNRVLEIVFELAQLADTRQKRRGVLRPKDDSLNTVVLELNTTHLLRVICVSN